MNIFDCNSGSKRRHLYDYCWLAFNQHFPKGELTEPNILILTGFKDSLNFDLIIIKNILLCTVEKLHLIHCNRQQLCESG